MKEDLHNDQLEQFFRKELVELEDAPSGDFWANLENKIPEKPSKIKGAILPFWRYGVAASIIGVLIFSVWQWVLYEKEMTQMANTIEQQNQNIEDLTNKIDDFEKNVTIEFEQDEEAIGGTTNPSKKDFLLAEDVDENNKPINENKNLQTKTTNDVNKLDTEFVVDKQTTAKKLLAVDSKHKKQVSDKLTEDGQTKNIDKNAIYKDGFNKTIKNKGEYLVNNSDNFSLQKVEKPVALIDKIGTAAFEQESMAAIITPIDRLPLKEPISIEPTNYLEHELFDLVALTTSHEVVRKPGVGKGFFVGARVAPTLAHRFIKHNDKSEKKKINEKEKLGFDYSLGAEIGYTFNKNWSIISGIGYTVENQPLRGKHHFPIKEDGGSSYSTLSSYGPINVNASFITSDNAMLPQNIASDVKGKIKVEFVNIPLLAEYRFGWKKFRLAVKSGFAAETIARISVNFDEIGDTENDQYSLASIQNADKVHYPSKKIHFNWIVGAGMYYALTDRLNIYVEPYLKGSLTPAFKNDKVKTYPYSLAVNTGFRFYL